MTNMFSRTDMPWRNRFARAGRAATKPSPRRLPRPARRCRASAADRTISPDAGAPRRSAPARCAPGRHRGARRGLRSRRVWTSKLTGPTSPLTASRKDSAGEGIGPIGTNEELLGRAPDDRVDQVRPDRLTRAARMSTSFPSRSTTSLSEIAKISSRRWET